MLRKYSFLDIGKLKLLNKNKINYISLNKNGLNIFKFRSKFYCNLLNDFEFKNIHSLQNFKNQKRGKHFFANNYNLTEFNIYSKNEETFFKLSRKNISFIHKNSSNKLIINKAYVNSYSSLILNKFSIKDFSTNNNQNQREHEDQNKKINSDSNKDIRKAQDENDSDSEDQVGFYNQRKKMIYIFTTSCLIILGMYLFLNYIKPEENVPLQKRMGQVTYVGSAKIGGPWKLYNTKGEIMTHKDLQGKYYLIYFGFTQCPDVCPMSLQKIAKTLTKISQSKEYKYFDLECLFISVDPDRDSFERIKNYCQLFHKNIIGLTSKSNDDPDLKAMLKEFKIHSSKIYLSKEDEEIDRKNLERNVPEIVSAMDKVKPKSQMKYSLDHTIVTYLMGPNNNFITYLSSNLNHEEMYNIVLEGIMNDLSTKIKGIPVEKSNKM